MGRLFFPIAVGFLIFGTVPHSPIAGQTPAPPAQAPAATDTLPAALQDYGADPALAFQPDTVIRPPNGVELILQRTPGAPSVALHLAIRLEESRIEAGTGAVLVEMGLARARGLASRVGAHLDGSRTPFGITYTVAGPIEELDYLAWVLRTAAAEPRREETSFDRAKARIRARVSSSRETPDGALARQLRAELTPGVPPIYGSLATLDGMGPGHPVEFWNRSHQPSRMTLVTVGDVAPVTLLALTRDIGAPEGASAPPLTAPGPIGDAPAHPQLLRNWYAQAHPLPNPGDPRNAALAFLVEEMLSSSRPGYELGVQLWEMDGVAAILLTGAAYAGDRRSMEARVEDTLQELMGILDGDRLSRARTQALDGVLSEAATPWGRARAMATYRLTSGDPGGAGAFVARLETLTLEEMVDYIRTVLLQSALTARLAP